MKGKLIFSLLLAGLTGLFFLPGKLNGQCDAPFALDYSGAADYTILKVQWTDATFAELDDVYKFRFRQSGTTTWTNIDVAYCGSSSCATGIYPTSVADRCYCPPCFSTFPVFPPPSSMDLYGLKPGTGYQMQVAKYCAATNTTSAYTPIGLFTTKTLDAYYNASCYTVPLQPSFATITEVLFNNSSSYALNSGCEECVGCNEATGFELVSGMVPMTVGSSVPMAVSLYSASTLVNSGNVKAWIDFNKDNDFVDSGEEVFNSSTSDLGPQDILTGSIFIPSNLVAGQYRMRIVFNATATPTPCGVFNKGKAVDFKLNITACPSPPTASITGPTAVCSGVANSFTASATGGTAPLSYKWSTGQTTATINQAFTTNTTLGVTVTDATGCANSKSLSIMANASPAAAFASLVNGLVVSFTNTSMGAASYLWNFGDGQTSIAASPSHTYATAGSYQVCLTATAANGCTQQACSNVIGFVKPCLDWQKSIGGTLMDHLASLQQTADGGYVLGGVSNSNIGGNKSEACRGDLDYWAVKVDATGDVTWEKTLGGNKEDYMNCILQTSDGGYLTGGDSQSDKTGDKELASFGGRDWWVVKLDAAGGVAWKKTLGGEDNDYLYSIQQTTDDNYIMGGSSQSAASGNKIVGTNGQFDYWLVKGTGSGAAPLWQKNFGGTGDDYLRSVQQTTDGGYVVGGFSWSGIGGSKTEGSNGSDYWVFKLNSTATVIEWQNTIGGLGEERLFAIQQTSDGGYILGGESQSAIGADKTEKNEGGWDYWVVKLDPTGVIQWQKTLGGSSDDILNSIQQTADGGFIVGGHSNSGKSGSKTEANLGGSDYWVVKLSATGTIEWQKTIGGTNDDDLYAVRQTADGGYILGGESLSNNGNVSGNHGLGDFWVAKLGDCATVLGCSPQLAQPVSGSIGVPTNTALEWAAAPGDPTGYRLSIGTTSGGTDILNNQDVGNVLSYQPAQPLPYEKDIFINITPYNGAAMVGGCKEFRFTTTYFYLPDACFPPDQVSPVDDCDVVCAYCNLDLNTYGGNTEGYSPGFVPIFCGSIENEQWIGFTAGGTTVTISVTPMNCTNGDGCQIALYEQCGGQFLACAYGCDDCGNMTQSITVNNMVIGTSYFLLVDGWAGDNCGFQLSATPASATKAPQLAPTGAVQGPAKTCPGATAVYSIASVAGAGGYIWAAPAGSKINGQDYVPFLGDPQSGISVSVEFGATVTGQVCVWPVNSCFSGNKSCIDINSFDVSVSGNPSFCTGGSTVLTASGGLTYAWSNGQTTSQATITQPGLISVTVTDANGCTASAQQTVVEQQMTTPAPAFTSIINGSVVSFFNTTSGATSFLWDFGDGQTSSLTNPTHTYSSGGTYLVTLNATNACGMGSTEEFVVTAPIACPTDDSWSTPIYCLTGNTYSMSFTVNCSGAMSITSVSSSGGTATKAGLTVQITGIPNGTSVTVNVSIACIFMGMPMTCPFSHQYAAADEVVITSSNGSQFCQNMANASLSVDVPGISSFQWEVGGSPIGGATSSSYTATTPGSYSVTWMDNGCTNETPSFLVSSFAAPVAGISGNLQFCSDKSTTLTGQGGQNYSWSTGANSPSIVATNAETISVTATDSNGCTDTAEVTTDTFPKPAVNLVIPALGNCVFSDIQLDETGGDATSWQWSGPGFSSSLQSPVLSNALPVMTGNYTVTVTENTHGCTSNDSAFLTVYTPVNYSAKSDSIICEGENLSLSPVPPGGIVWEWYDYGGGLVSTDQSAVIFSASSNPPDIYTLIITDVHGCTDMAEVTADIRTIPPAEFDPHVVGLTIQPEYTSYPHPLNTTYKWIYGDGGGSMLEYPPKYTYAMAGPYEICLYVTNLCGTDSICQQTVIGGGVPTAPTAAFAPSVSTGCPGLQVSFANQSTANSTSFLWDFQGGMPATSTAQNPGIVTFPAPGDWLVSLAATNANGSNTSQTTIHIDPPPFAVFTNTINGLTVSFANGSQNATTFLWDFDDGTTSTEQNPTHNFASAGNYSVCLTANGPCGQATECQTLAVTGNQVPCSILVTTTADSGPGSFREAILCANSHAGSDTIRFSILGPPIKHTFQLQSGLPEITDDGTVIDATTQPGWLLGSSLILDGSLFSVDDELLSAFGSASDPLSGFELHGFILRNGKKNGLFLAFCENFKITKNAIYQNYLLHPDDGGNIGLSQCKNGVIQSNNIGLSEALLPQTNYQGAAIAVWGENILIGGNRAANEGNNIGNTLNGVVIYSNSMAIPSHDITIRGDSIFNCERAIWVDNASKNIIIGSDQASEANSILQNTLCGVCINDAESDVQAYRNRFFCNTEGIHYEVPSPNAPAILSALTGSVTGTAAAGSTIRLFQHGDPACLNAVCQGKGFWGQTTADISGNWSLIGPFPVAAEMTATATLNGKTSPFSACQQICPTFSLSASGDTTICAGQPTSLKLNLPTAGGPFDVIYNDGTMDFTLSDIANGYVLNLSPAATTTYLFKKIGDPGGCETVLNFQKTVVVSPPLLLTANQQQPPAVPGVAEIGFSGGTPPFKYEWSGPANGNQTGQPAGNYLITNLLAGNYSLLLTDALGCTTTQNFSISNCPLMISSAVSPDTCGEGRGKIDLSVSSTATGTFSYLWSNGATTEDLSGLAAGSYSVTVTLTQTSGNTCSATHSPPSIGKTPTFSIILGLVECLPGDDFYTVGFTISGGVLPFKVNGVPIASNTFTSAPIASGTSYSFDIEDKYGCSLLLAGSKNCKCNTPPIPKITIGGGPTYCSGQLIQLGETSGQATSWNWSGPGGFSSMAQNPTVILTTSGVFSVTITDADTCQGIVSKSISVNQSPAVVADGDPDLCEKQPLILKETGGATGVSWKWTGPGGFVSNVKNPPTISQPQNGIYKVVVTAGGCSAADSLAVSIHPEDLTELESTICAGQNLVFDGKTLTKTGSYEALLKNRFGCDSLVRLTLIVNEGSIETFDDAATILPGETEIELEILKNDSLNLSGGWQLAILESPSVGTASPVGNERILFKMPLTATDFQDSLLYEICAETCPDLCDSAWARLIFLTPCFEKSRDEMPHGLSPDGHEKNRIFDPFAIFEKNGCPFETRRSSMAIVGRDGHVVWKRDPYEAWDGGEAPMATYYFMLRMRFEGNDDEVVLKGPVTLVRRR